MRTEANWIPGFFQKWQTAWSRNLFLASQILIGLVNPIGTRRIEHVKIHCIFECFRLMRHVRRDAKHLAGMDNDFFAVNPKLQRAIEM